MTIIVRPQKCPVDMFRVVFQKPASRGRQTRCFSPPLHPVEVSGEQYFHFIYPLTVWMRSLSVKLHINGLLIELPVSVSPSNDELWVTRNSSWSCWGCFFCVRSPFKTSQRSFKKGEEKKVEPLGSDVIFSSSPKLPEKSEYRNWRNLFGNFSACHICTVYLLS